MSTQEIQDYKLNWLTRNSFRVILKEVSGEDCLSWLKENLEEKLWEYSKSPATGQHTFFFESAQDAEAFRWHFQNDSRTVDIS